MVRVVRAELSVHVHATEEESRVLVAVNNLVPEDVRDRVSVERSVVEGHYSNPIVRVVVKIPGEYVEKLLRYLGERLDDIDRSYLDTTLERRYDSKSGRLYIRFGKQEAFLGDVRLADGDDVVRLVIIFRKAPRLEEVRSFLRETGLLS